MNSTYTDPISKIYYVLIVSKKFIFNENPIIEIYYQYTEENKVRQTDCYLDEKDIIFGDHDFKAPLKLKNMCKKYYIMKAFW